MEKLFYKKSVIILRREIAFRYQKITDKRFKRKC